ncbi:MAG: nicotinamide-nucleotide amidohydrolase family protein, partial [Desulfovibrionaceae bacterium]|nr:nicotinamide-nucleotide amidohydrolase family protein [Desulfovibrionaceae bacterium]
MTCHKIHVFGLTLTEIESKLTKLLNSSDPKLTLSANQEEISIDLIAKDQPTTLIQEFLSEIQNNLGAYLYGIDVDNLETLAVSELRKRKLKLALAESCTGGLLAKRLTDQSGASEIFGFGFVTYSNEAKMELLGVPSQTLSEHGAVSFETAQAMAKGARLKGHADLALAI